MAVSRDKGARLSIAGLVVSGAAFSFVWRRLGALVVVVWRARYKILIKRCLSERQRMFTDCFDGMEPQQSETVEEIVVEISREL